MATDFRAASLVFDVRDWSHCIGAFGGKAERAKRMAVLLLLRQPTEVVCRRLRGLALYRAKCKRLERQCSIERQRLFGINRYDVRDLARAERIVLDALERTGLRFFRGDSLGEWLAQA